MAEVWTYSEYVGRLLLAAICGGLIGYERENNTRPAGLRTHILVCVASALIMITSDYVFFKYSGIVNIDPLRMGAQIVSGIGFLGAGTIIKDGLTVRGLTTAACLWAVACVGIAVGAGFYLGALMTTGIVFIVLILMRRMEHFLTHNMILQNLYVEIVNSPNALSDIEGALLLYRVRIRGVYKICVNETLYVKYRFSLSEAIPKAVVMRAVREVGGVISVSDTDRV